MDNEDELDDSVWDRFCWRYRAEAERLRNFPRLTDRTDAGILAFVDALCAQEGLDDEARVGMFKALRAVVPDPQGCYRHAVALSPVPDPGVPHSPRGRQGRMANGMGFLAGPMPAGAS